MDSEIEKLVRENWGHWDTGGLDEASIRSRLPDSDRDAMIRWFNGAFDECELPRTASSLKEIVDLASWCISRRDSILFYPPNIRSVSINAAATNDFQIAPKVLGVLLQTSGNILATGAGK